MQEHSREKDHKRTQKFIIRLIIVIIIIDILLHIIRLPIIIEKTVMEPYVDDVPYQAVEEYVDRTCFNTTYRHQWDILSSEPPESSFATPYIDFENIEGFPGTYRFQFAFIDNTKYPYGMYNDKDLWNVADFYSQTKEVSFEARSKQTVSIPTTKPNPTGQYWAIVSVDSPIVMDCENTTKTRIATRNRQETLEKPKKVKETVRKTLWEIIVDWWENKELDS